MTEQPAVAEKEMKTESEGGVDVGNPAERGGCAEEESPPQSGAEKLSGDTEDETVHIDPVEDALNASETVRDMAVGLAACAAVFAAAGCIFMGAQWYRWVFGILLGACAAGLMLRHLYVTIDRALDMDEKHASKYMKKSATLRILMAGAALAIGAFVPEAFHVFGVFFGVLCLKFTAYLQPLTHKIIKFLSKGR